MAPGKLDKRGWFFALNVQRGQASCCCVSPLVSVLERVRDRHASAPEVPEVHQSSLFQVFCVLLTLLVSTSCLSAAEFSAGARLVLQEHCAECHDADTQKGNLRVDQLSLQAPGQDQLNRLVLLFDRVQSGEMPPKKAEQPGAAARTAFLEELGSAIRGHEKQTAERFGGRTSVRRMNRVEYEHTLRDLLGVPLLRVKEMLPEDGQQFGFDKVAGALDLSHIQMSKYLQAAETALRQAAATAPAKPVAAIWRESAAKQATALSAIAVHAAVPLKARELAPGLTTHIVGNPLKDTGNCYRGASFRGEADSVAMLSGVIGAHQPEGLQPDRFRPAAAGLYRVRFSVWSLRWMRDHVAPATRGRVQSYSVFERPDFKTRLPEEKPAAGWMENVEFYGDAPVTQVVRASLKGQPLGYFDAPSLHSREHEFTVWLNPGEKVSFHAMTLPATGAANHPDKEGVRTYEGPAVAFDWFEVEGPLLEQWPPASHVRLFGGLEPAQRRNRADVPDARQQLLQSFATAAFRRPVEPGELDPYHALAAAELQRGASFEDALLSAYKAILCSPDFLMIGLESGVPRGSKLGEYALASRLSFFLWNTLPDGELLGLASTQALSMPGTLSAQVVRMLADPRAERFITHFLDEWLELRKIDFTTPDPNLYPEYDPWLHDSMLAETRASFRRLLAKNLGVRELIAGDTVLINQRLAELYGIRGVTGSELREVALPAGSKRGGFLTQAAILKVTANGTATSPVLRGVWVMERILGNPRQPPPPNVPAVEPDATGAATIREMLQKHQADAACASCHARMDPPGFALEHFDAIGGFRERYRVAGKPKGARDRASDFVEVVSEAGRRNRSTIRLGPAVDASGSLADGRPFADIDGLRALLLKDEDALARNVVRQLMTYATGAGVRFCDREAIDTIVSRTKPSGHGMLSLVREIVASELFQSK
jgi:cytochrome c553